MKKQEWTGFHAEEVIFKDSRLWCNVRVIELLFE